MSGDRRHRWRGRAMDLYDILDHVVALLQRRGRVTYNALKLQFHLDDEQLAVLKEELLYAHPQVVDDAGRGLRWKDDSAATQAHTPPAPQHELQPISQADYPPQDAAPRITPRPQEAERASSRYCSVTWPTPPASPVSSTRKTSVRSCWPIKRPVSRCSSASMGMWPSIW